MEWWSLPFEVPHARRLGALETYPEVMVDAPFGEELHIEHFLRRSFRYRIGRNSFGQLS